MYQILESISTEEIDYHTGIHIYNKCAFDEENLIDTKIQTPHIAEDLRTNSHPNIQSLINNKIITLENVKHLNVYGVIREPIDRIISCAQHLFYNENGVQRSNTFAVYSMLDQMDKNRIMKNSIYYNIFYRPQTHWLIHDRKQINRIFKYENISNLLFNILGNSELKYHYRSHTRKNKEKKLSLELEQEVRRRYPEDFALWESLS